MPYDKRMKLTGMTLETEAFEEYLSFLTEVLELDLQELTDLSMRLDLQGTWLEIKKISSAKHQIATVIEFGLNEEEFEDLLQKMSFFNYRRSSHRFIYIESTKDICQIVDPDGRTWRFTLIPPMTLDLNTLPYI